jgi:hypothetical protein
MGDWREAESLRTLRLQLNEAFPKRSKLSDGGIGDARHATSNSDHNPHIKDRRGVGVYTARDFTHDPKTGIDCNWLAETLVRNRDPRVKYIIWNKRIISSKVSPWTWRPYSGANSHSKHLHISVDPVLYDRPAKWRLDFPTPARHLVEPDIARVTEEAEEIDPESPANTVGVPTFETCPDCGVAYDIKDRRPSDDLCPDCGAKADEETLRQEDAAARSRVENILGVPDSEPKKETATGETGGEPPKTEVQPTKLKGYYAAILGFIATNLSVAAETVQASIFIGGGIATAALIIGVIWIKNNREERAAQKDLTLINTKQGDV